MERLEAALKQALTRNAAETERLTQHREEQETAISNMNLFKDSLTVDIMVPVGTKAFMPGYLCHTNEVLVSHYEGYFSKCTSQQAQNIAKHRIKKADAHLHDLEQEREMYQNRLEKPYLEGVLPTGAELEIVEEYDEEKEKQWRKEHERRVREEKLKAVQPESESQQEKTHDDIMAMLENLEIMEELDDDLQYLENEDGHKFEELMSGEVEPSDDKKTVSLSSENDIIGTGVEKEPVDEIVEKLKEFIVADVKKNTNYTNNNILPNTEDNTSDIDDSESTSTEDIPLQILEMEEESKYFPTAQKLKFFKKKLKDVEKELQEMVLKTAEDVQEKMDKMEVRAMLYDYIQVLKDELNPQPLLEPNSSRESIVKELVTDDKMRKRITFSNKDEVQLIDKTQAPNMVTRSKIELSADSYRALNLTPPSTLEITSPLDGANITLDTYKKKDILDKVQKCIEFIAENQSHEDFNLVDKIIDSTESKCHTLEIKFNHSDNYFTPPGYEIDKSVEMETIGSPADVYRVFNHYFPSEQHETQFTSNVPDSDHATINDRSIDTRQVEAKLNGPTTSSSSVNREKPIGSAINLTPVNFKDRAESDETTNGKLHEPVKSILKNKENSNPDAVKQTPAKSQGKKPKPIKKDNDKNSGPNSIIGEVLERKSPFDSENMDIVADSPPSTCKPDPLPEENFVDVHAPKARVSRFKQMRAYR